MANMKNLLGGMMQKGTLAPHYGKKKKKLTKFTKKK